MEKKLRKKGIVVKEVPINKNTRGLLRFRKKMLNQDDIKFLERSTK